MKLSLVADGEWRVLQSPELQERLRKLRLDLAARHAEAFAAAGFFGRCRLRGRMALAYWRERREMIPSPYSLYAVRSARVDDHAA